MVYLSFLATLSKCSSASRECDELAAAYSDPGAGDLFWCWKSVDVRVILDTDAVSGPSPEVP